MRTFAISQVEIKKTGRYENWLIITVFTDRLFTRAARYGRNARRGRVLEASLIHS